jgi:MOSC domain-containing protein YiiM
MMKIVSLAVSKKKGTRKKIVEEALLVQDHGIEGDAHAGPWHRQVSFLAAVLVEVTQIGKECHNRCAIYYQAGDCIMPKEGIFARVLEGGKIRPGDIIAIEGEL